MDVEQTGGGEAGAGKRKKRPWSAFNIIEKKGLRKPLWNKIGVAWVNQDGSFSIVLDSLPLDGKVHIREERERDRPEQRELGELQASIERVE